MIRSGITKETMKKQLEEAIEMLEKGVDLEEVNKEIFENSMFNQPRFEELLKREIISDIKLQFDDNLETEIKKDLNKNKINTDRLAENLISDRLALGTYREEGFYDKLSLDELVLQNLKYYENEDDLFSEIKEEVENIKNETPVEEWNASKELGSYMKLGYKEILNDGLRMLDVEKEIRNSTLLLGEYKLDDENLMSGDIKTIANVLAKETNIEKTFSEDEILKDITIEKELAPSFDKEKIDKKIDTVLKKLYSDWRDITEEALKDIKKGSLDCGESRVLEDFNEYVSQCLKETDGISEIAKKEFEFYADDKIEFEKMFELEKEYNKEHGITNLEEYTVNLIKDYEDYIEEYNFYEEKNKNLSKENLEGLRNEIKNFQKNILMELKNEKLEKISDEEYKFKDDILTNNENYREFCDYYVCQSTTFPFEKYMTNEEAIKRYDLESYLPTFQIMNENEEILFDSKEKNVSENLEAYIKTIKGQEFWDNMDINSIRSWENLNLNIVCEEEEKKYNYDGYDNYIKETLAYEKLIEKMSDEVDFYADEVKNELKKNTKNDIIKEKDLEIIENRYKEKSQPANDFKDINKEEIKEKVVLKDNKEMDI